jgi:hypothetical protein
LPSRFWASKAAGIIGIAALAALAVTYVHGVTAGYGLNYDDYYFLRPHSLQQVGDSFHGPWDVTGVMVKFYRPLTVAFSALRFELLGLNAVAHHTVSLVLFAACVTIAAWLVLRWTGRRLAAFAAVLFVVVHPAMPYSLVAWITNQMHLLQTVTVLAALAWWDVVRARGLRWWLPLLLLAAASFTIKEDGVMLLPAIVAIHEIRRWTAEPLPRVHAGFVLLAALLLGGLMMWRAHVLGGVGGYTQLSFDKAWTNFFGALDGVYRLVPADRPWQPLASWFATLTPIAALVAWPWSSRGARFCLGAGAAIAVLFALPFVFIAKPEQVYLVGLGFSIVLTGSVLALADAAARSPQPRAAAAIVAAAACVGIGSMMAVARDITRDFEPYGPYVLANDDLVRTWGFVPPEIKDYLLRKREPGAAARLSSNPIDEVKVATFGSHGRETSPDGVPYVWMAGLSADIYIAAGVRKVMIPLRHAIESFRDAAHVRVIVDGRLADDIVLGTPEWMMSTIAIREADLPRVARMHRIRLVLDRAWLPTEVIPGSNDGRLLGLQIGAIEIR